MFLLGFIAGVLACPLIAVAVIWLSDKFVSDPLDYQGFDED